jgi:hypothetical protein
MKAKEVCHAIFNLVVRLLGLLFLYHGLSSLPAVMQIFSNRHFSDYIIGSILFLWPLAVAWWLIGGAPQLMERAYPESDKEPGERVAAPERLP